MNTLTIDIKTCSHASIKKNGIFAYAQHNSTRILCVTLKKNFDPPLVWLPPELRRSEISSISDDQLCRMLKEADMIQAYDITTEFAFWKYTLRRLFPQFPEIPVMKLSCLAAGATHLGMGFSRYDLAVIFQLDRPDFLRKKNSFKINVQDYRSMTAEDLGHFIERCKAAVEFEEKLAAHFLGLPSPESKIWQMGLIINDRGITVNRKSLADMIASNEEEKIFLQDEFTAITGIPNPMNDEAFLKYVRNHGIALESPTISELDRALAPLPGGVLRRVLEIRLRIAHIRQLNCKIIPNLLNSRSQLQGIWEYYGTASGEWGVKHLASIFVLNGIAQTGKGKQFRSCIIPGLRENISSWLLDGGITPSEKFSHDLLDACKKAVSKRGNAVFCGKIGVSSFGRFLKIILPSGRDLFLHDPEVDHAGKFHCRIRVGRQCVTRGIGSGYLLRLVERALARDIMMAVSMELVRNGMIPVLMTGNEIVIEHDAADSNTASLFDSTIKKLPEWCGSIPLRFSVSSKSVWETAGSDQDETGEG